MSDEHESSEGDCDREERAAVHSELGSQMSMNPRKGTVTSSESMLIFLLLFESDEHESSEGDCDKISEILEHLRKLRQMSMNPRKGTVTPGWVPAQRVPRAGSDEHESSEGDCDLLAGQTPHQIAVLSDEHESSEGDCDRHIPRPGADQPVASQMSMNPRKGTVTPPCHHRRPCRLLVR